MLKIVFFLIVLIFFIIVTPYLYFSYKISQLNMDEREIVKTIVAEFKKVDRCDPFPCMDHFLFESVEKLEADREMHNTGAALLSTDCELDNYFMEMQANVNNSSPSCTCKKGNWLIEFYHGSWISLSPFKEKMSVCYR